MCGIVAFCSAKPQESLALDEDALKDISIALHKAASKLYHRGPDDLGVYVSDDGLLGLGHSRLSIIDVEGGHQPLHSLDGTVHAIVNGELYDYDKLRPQLEAAGCVFQTRSDSELIIHLYKTKGQNMLSSLRGEFAFVLYDSARELVFAARDRFGIKPCFYGFGDGRIFIASEIKAFLPLGWKPKWDLDSVVNMGDWTDDRTIFEGVYKLPPGHFLTFNQRSGRTNVQPYWEQDFCKRDNKDPRTLEEMIAGVRERVVDAVKARLRSDVPIAIFLSGGLDSCSVAGIAAHLLKHQDHNATLNTFTLAFPDRPDHDEGPVAQRMAAHIGASSEMVTPSEKDLIDNFERSVWHTESPISTLHCVGKILLAEHVRDRGFKVVLTGEGADEVFAGYTYHQLDYLRAPDESASCLGLDAPTNEELKEILAQREGMVFPQDHLSLSQLSFDDATLGRSMLGGISIHRIWAAQCVPPELFSTKVLGRHGPIDHTRTIAEGLTMASRLKMSNREWHPLNSALYTMGHCHLSNWLLNGLGDRPEMAGSIEGRPPFLDHVLSEYAQHLPPSVKILPTRTENADGTVQWGFTEKYILREAVRPFITEEIYTRRKKQYNALLPRHDKEDLTENHTPSALQELLRKRLTRETVDRLGWANWSYIGSLLEQYLSSPGTPQDGGLDRRARILLVVASYTMLQEQFGIPTAVVP